MRIVAMSAHFLNMHYNDEKQHQHMMIYVLIHMRQ